MAKISRISERAPGAFPEFIFECPGCGCDHGIKTDGAGPCWTFNGDLERPTIQPSILVRWSRAVPSAEDPEVRAKIARGEIVQTQQDRICHSFVTDGRIQFLTDCTHALAGQTVPLPDID